ncbi:MAG: hypothetical protein ACOYNW_08220, partial [Undibacterium curvum]
MLESLKSSLSQYRAQRIVKRSTLRDILTDIPPGLFLYWQQTAQQEFPGIPQDAVFFASAAEGLCMFFECVRRSEQPCALPSKAADSVWHAWLRYSSISLEQFCDKHYERQIPHLSASEMSVDLELALAATLIQARRFERQCETDPILPALFTLDKRLRMPNGYAYHIGADKPGYRAMNRDGQAYGASYYPEALQAYGMLTAGMISATMYEHYKRREAERQQSSYIDTGSSGSYSSDSSSYSSSNSNNSDCS